MYLAECRFIARLVKQTMSQVVNQAFPTIKADILLQNGPKNQCQYVSPSAMKLFNMNKDKKTGDSLGCKSVEEFAQKIVDSLHENDVIQSLAVHDKGFIRIKVKEELIEKQINGMMESLEYPDKQEKMIVVDFSSPNIAKEMHVGHLRSTILGESFCRLQEYLGNKVVRANHVGDWGTQFGMLIAYMKETFPDYQTSEPDIKDLDEYYKAARAKFDSDPEFKKQSQETVVRLQALDPSCIKAWTSICQVSRQYFQKIYNRLHITLEEFGESFYNPFIPDMLKELDALGLIVEDDTKTKKGAKVEKAVVEAEKLAEVEAGDGRKAKCIFIEKYPIPLMVVKSDGGYNYDTTDLACIKYRLQTLKADRIVYITDLGQREHFEMVIAAAKKAGWLTNQRAEHMGFGVVLGQNKKKFSTRKGVSVKLMDLLNEAHEKAFNQLKSREKDENDEEEKDAPFTSLKPEEYDEAAEKLGIAGIKYYDLKQNRISDYVFDFDKMLDPRGNTAVYLIYAYVRMCSIIRKSGLSSEDIHNLAQKSPFKITHPDERVLAGMLIKFFDVLHESSEEMAINKITDYIFDIAMKVQENYKKYRIMGDPNMESRIILVECIRKVLEKAFYMVGIVPVDKI